MSFDARRLSGLDKRPQSMIDPWPLLTIMSWEFQNFYQIMDIKTSAAPFSNLTFGFDMIISELPP
jgi:hypothetical protein